MSAASVTNICVESQFLKDDEIQNIIGVLHFSPIVTKLIVQRARDSGIVKKNASDEAAIKAFTLNSLIFFFNVLSYEDAGYKTLLLAPNDEVYEWSAKSFTEQDLLKDEDLQ
jgi:hypothetical protein